jgi:NACalpha-BTF3-like transcription factor
MGRISEAFYYANIPTERLSSDGVKSNFFHIEINEAIKAFRKHIQQQKRDYESELVKNSLNSDKSLLESKRKDLDLKEKDIELVSEGKMTIEEFKAKWN